MSTVVITYDGVDITDKIIIASAKFTAAAKGVPGACEFMIKDLTLTESFITGKEVILEIDGLREWGGYVTAVSRSFFFPVDDPDCDGLVPRGLLIEGVDYGILLNKRVIRDKTTPTNMELTVFPQGTSDRTVILTYFAHSDLAGDGVGTTLVEAVDTPSLDAKIAGHAGWTFNQFLYYVSTHVGSIWYMNPDKNLVYTDVDTPNAPFGISDDPGPGEIGCHGLEIDLDGNNLINDVMVWGAGQGDDEMVFRRIQDADSIAAHGRWQEGNVAFGAWKQATVDKIANSYVYGSPQSQRGHKDDNPSARCRIFTSGFRVADKVLLRSEVHNYSNVIPIRSITITFAAPTEPIWDLILSHEIDDPYSAFDPLPFVEPVGPVIEIPEFDCDGREHMTLPTEVLTRFRLMWTGVPNGDMLFGQFGSTGFVTARRDVTQEILRFETPGIGIFATMTGGFNGVWIWMRTRIDHDAQYVRFWRDGLVEPDLWQLIRYWSVPLSFDPNLAGGFQLSLRAGHNVIDPMTGQPVRATGGRVECDGLLLIEGHTTISGVADNFDRVLHRSIGSGPLGTWSAVTVEGLLVSDRLGEADWGVNGDALWIESTENKDSGIYEIAASISFPLSASEDVSCGDNFQNRNLSSATSQNWGLASGMFGEAWTLEHHEGTHGWEISNGEVFISRYAPVGVGDRASQVIRADHWVSVPIELFFRFSTDGHLESTVFWEFYGSGSSRIRVSATTIDESGNTTITLSRRDSLGNEFILTRPQPLEVFNDFFHVKAFLTSNEFSLKAWYQGGEPNYGAATSFYGIAPLDETELGYLTHLRYQWEVGVVPILDPEDDPHPTAVASISNFGIFQGYDCGDICLLGGIPQIENPPSGWTCRNLARIDVPPGQPTNRSYFTTGVPYMKDQNEVWIDGIYIPPSKYIQGHTAGWIGIDGSIHVGGDEARNPSKTIRMCYFAKSAYGPVL